MFSDIFFEEVNAKQEKQPSKIAENFIQKIAGLRADVRKDCFT